MSDLKFKVSLLLGHAALDSFFRIENGMLVGYGRATHYDQYGNITKVTESATGVVIDVCGWAGLG